MSTFFLFSFKVFIRKFRIKIIFYEKQRINCEIWREKEKMNFNLIDERREARQGNRCVLLAPRFVSLIYRSFDLDLFQF